MPKILCVDFDGVLHSYLRGWTGTDSVLDPPVAGAMSWLYDLGNRLDFDVAIYSSRSKDPSGLLAMKRALAKWMIEDGYLSEDSAWAWIEDKLDFPTQKPAAFLTIDDRAICFTGKFPTPAELAQFKTWQDK